MLVGLIISIFFAWASFMGVGMSILAGNAIGCFYYGIGLIVSGVATRLFFDKV